MAALIGTEHTYLFDVLEVWMTDIYTSYARYNSPVLTSASMRLEREALSWVDDEFFYLEEWGILEYIVDSPWTIPYFEVSSLCY